MKNNNNFIMAFFAGFLFFSCAGGADNRSGLWQYRVFSGMQGSRLEYRRGQLFYRSRPLPGGIEVIVSPGGRFFYRRMQFRQSGWYGWVREPVPSEYQHGFKEEEGVLKGTDRYWYRSAFGRKKAGTPPYWVWVRVSGRGYWVDPDGLDFFIPRWQSGVKLKGN